MKELEHVLQRVRVRLPDGSETKLRERVYAVLRVLGAATLSGAPDRGCQLSIEEISKRSYKQRSTVLAALAEARQLGLLTRHAPAPGAAWPTHINIFSIRLVEAAQKSRPFLGPPIIFDGRGTPPQNTQKTAAGETRKMQKSEDLQGFQATQGVQLLDVQYLDPEVIFKHPRPPPDLLLSSPDDAAPPPVFPAAPSRGASGGDSAFLSPFSGGRPKKVSLLPAVFGELEVFSNFLEKNNAGLVTTHFQHRKKDGQRGGKYMQQQPADFQELVKIVMKAAAEKVEVACRAENLILVDDLTESSLGDLKKEGFEMAVIETSAGNFQALLATGPGWTLDQKRDTQRALAARFGGDGGAVAAGQPHRLPGSLNLKNNGFWVTKLSTVQAGRLVDPVDQIFEPARKATVTPSKFSAPGRDTSPSGQDFGRACQLLVGGAPPAQVEAEISARAAARSKPGRPEIYAAITVKAALSRLSSPVV